MGAEWGSSLTGGMRVCVVSRECVSVGVCCEKVRARECVVMQCRSAGLFLSGWHACALRWSASVSGCVHGQSSRPCAFKRNRAQATHSLSLGGFCCSKVGLCRLFSSTASSLESDAKGAVLEKTVG